jgi:hypothetical protein
MRLHLTVPTVPQHHSRVPSGDYLVQYNISVPYQYSISIIGEQLAEDPLQYSCTHDAHQLNTR